MHRSLPTHCLFGVLVACASLRGAERYPLDWKKVAPEAIDHFIALLKIDTSNPPGNETKAAKYLQGVLARAGVEAKLLANDPARANLVARLRGNGSKRPVLVMGHTDVVGVQREKWSVDPFAGIRKGGFIYARGARDDKPHVAAGLMLLLLLKRMNVKLDRDVIFLAEAGEEGSTGVGIGYMVDHCWKEIEAEYALAEGGATLSRGGVVRKVVVTTTEKIPRGIRLVSHGTAGHGSVPRQDNAVVRLARAVAKVGVWQPPMRLNDTTRAYFERLATVSSREEAGRYLHISDPVKGPEIERYFAANEPMHYSVLRTSISPTMMKAGFRANVIPSEAEAYLDVRALPDEDIGKFCSELRKVIGDPNVDVIPPSDKGRPVGAPSRLDTEMFRALEHVQKRMFPKAVTLPSMLTGATDMAQLRARGVQAYGFGPIVSEEERDKGGAHTDDERIAETSLPKMIEYLWDAVLEVAASHN